VHDTGPYGARASHPPLLHRQDIIVFEGPHGFKGQAPNKTKITPYFVEETEFEEDDELDEWNGHEGLWVTMTPTTMLSSLFFDTLLILVVSPLVTLTVVYALLLLRSRIRR
jgi:hypothetical protein